MFFNASFRDALLVNVYTNDSYAVLIFNFYLFYDYSHKCSVKCILYFKLKTFTLYYIISALAWFSRSHFNFSCQIKLILELYKFKQLLTHELTVSLT